MDTPDLLATNQDRGIVTPVSVRRLVVECGLVFLLSTGVLYLAFVFIDNTALLTGNGLWKSLKVKEWAEKDPSRQVQAANTLYFPTYGFLVRSLPESTFGPVWRRMTLLNVGFAGLALAFLHLLLRGLVPTLNAVSGVLFQLGCAFFLGLAICSEDIMPGFALLVGAMAAAVWVAKKPTQSGVALVSVMFTLAWLFEWRLMFPTIGPLLLALFLLENSWKRRLTLLGVALATSFVLVALAAWLYPPSESYWRSLARIVFSGKGVESGWGGFSWRKLAFLLEGMSQYFLGGGTSASLERILQPKNFIFALLQLAVLAGVGTLFVVRLSRNWYQPDWRTAGVVLLGTFVCGEFFNSYVQPQDPQFQINPLMVMPVAWGVFSTFPFPLLGRKRIVQGLVFLTVSLLPFFINMYIYSAKQGWDSRKLALVREMESRFDTDRTVFFGDSGGLVTWRAVSWDFSPELQERQPAPQKIPKYKFIFLHQEASHYPKRTPTESAKSICDQIDSALTNGYDVVVSHIWDWPETRFIDSFSTICGPEKPRAIYRALKRKYRAERVETSRALGAYYRLLPQDR